MSPMLSNNQIVTTLLGTDVTVTINSNGDVFIDNVLVTLADVVGDNGVVHIIDAVLIPSGVSLPTSNVSIVPENKNVILEEFTGIQCVYCPDGHLIASQIQSNNINDVYIIKIHSGTYSYPSMGQPDFRTQ